MTLGSWGVKSYEIDEAADALDAAFDLVHGSRYDELMDDRNPMTVDQIHKMLATPETLTEAIEALKDEFGEDLGAWDEVARLGLAGVVVRHAELGVPIPGGWKRRAVEWLEQEEIEWHEATARRLRREREVALLNRASTAELEEGEEPR